MTLSHLLPATFRQRINSCTTPVAFDEGGVGRFGFLAVRGSDVSNSEAKTVCPCPQCGAVLDSHTVSCGSCGYSPYDSPSDDREVARQTAKLQRTRGATTQIAIATLLLLPTPLLTCLCGHFNLWTLVVTLPGVVFAWLGFERSVRNHPHALVCAVPIVCLSSLAFAKNMVDIIWSGHNPLWPM